MKKLPDGPGAAGSFLGLEGELACFETAEVCIIPAPFEASTSFGHGTSNGPAALIEASRNIEGYDVETQCEVFNVGIHTTAPLEGDSPQDFLNRLEKETERIVQAGKFPVILGGEHTITAAPIRALARFHEEFSILQFDAHTDLRDEYEGNPLSHACVMARAKECPKVRNVVAVGIRAMDISERENSIGEDLFFDHVIESHPAWIDAVIERLAPKVYITFDLDVFDTATMPSTGTPEPGGMGWFACMRLLQRVCREREVIGFDVVELMPLSMFKAPDFLAAKVVYKFLNYRFAAECC
ncbi:MAG: agmatinase [Bdellovibrionales bacterium]|nr:agmatinase [Bdellovibrionales bacterium]